MRPARRMASEIAPFRCDPLELLLEFELKRVGQVVFECLLVP